MLALRKPTALRRILLHPMATVFAPTAAENATDPEVPSAGASPDESCWECGIANTRQDREAAFSLIYQAYVRSGLGVPNAHQKRVTPYQLLPTTTIFNAKLTTGEETGFVFSTVSLVCDGTLGLPLEKIYPDLVAHKRAQGFRLAEVSCLADRRRDIRRFFSVFCALNRWMIQFAREAGVDQVLVAVHPKHARFYTRNMGFKVVGDVAQYPSVCNRPAVPLCFDFARNDESHFPYYDRFFASPIPREQLLSTPPTSMEIAEYQKWIDPAFFETDCAFSRSAAG